MRNYLSIRAAPSRTTIELSFSIDSLSLLLQLSLSFWLLNHRLKDWQYLGEWSAIIRRLKRGSYFAKLSLTISVPNFSLCTWLCASRIALYRAELMMNPYSWPCWLSPWEKRSSIAADSAGCAALDFYCLGNSSSQLLLRSLPSLKAVVEPARFAKTLTVSWASHRDWLFSASGLKFSSLEPRMTPGDPQSSDDRQRKLVRSRWLHCLDLYLR